MKISAKTEYACIAVLELAKNHDSNEPVRIRNIAEQHQVPPRFLVQILLQLKGAGIVSSTRGAAGGYHLIPQPDEVTLGQVMNIIDGPSQISKRGSEKEVTNKVVNLLGQVWNTAEQKRQDHLCSISFADLVKIVADISATVEPSASSEVPPPASILAPPPIPVQPQDPMVQESRSMYA